MTIYIALLRGINVGGNHVIKMAELRSVFEEMGFSNVQSYIQSGNVLFETQEENERQLRERIEKKLSDAFQYKSTVLIRTAEELGELAANCPFSAEAIVEAEAMGPWESLYVSMLTVEPSSEKIEQLKAVESGQDEFRVTGRDVYLLLRQSVRHSKLAAALQKLELPSTVRNWKTLNKLVKLSEAMRSG